MTAPRDSISVVIPAFNARRFLGEAIGSVRAQTIPVLEIIVVDDGSRDGTHRVAMRAGARLIRQSNRGPAAARNAGIRAAAGGWVAFLDADDMWDVDKLERQMALARRVPDAAVISCDRRTVRRARIIEPSYLATVKGYRGLLRRHIDAESSYFGHVAADFLASGCVLLPSTLLIRRAVFRSVGCFGPQLRGYEDFEFLLRALAHHPLGIVEHPLVTYRLHSANLHDDIPMMRVNAKILESLVRANPSRYPPGTHRALAWVGYL